MNTLVIAVLLASAAVCLGQQFDFGGGFDGAGAGAGGGGGFDTSSFGSPDSGAQLGGDFSGGFGGADGGDGGAGAGFDSSGFTGGFQGFNAAAASSSRPQFGGFQSQFQGGLPQGGGAPSSAETQ